MDTFILFPEKDEDHLKHPAVTLQNVLPVEMVLLNVCQLIYVCMSGERLKCHQSTYLDPSLLNLKSELRSKEFLFCPWKLD